MFYKLWNPFRWGNCVLFVERSGEFARTGKVKDLTSGAEVKASVKSAKLVSEGRPETG
ncbi:hypothetical protein ANACAC_03299 [Anaerostipes caccae L1-92]|uniref:Uncharacterized protein n=1 Tax=Anaerostipes caccae (strain DSM 14662 / CCUG 47493 / JCM 13470 / NCIMB 13811 / L1-92) TaxID=411490 RepID=B0MI61_ANACD|nr:hypothetical protein ANACAC_03299 [Anaerostipes caccae L1-92]